MIKVSVIVPVYNVENYIEECIKSIINQSLKDIEILVIDDGSQDKSIDIVKTFNDERITIFSKKNGGLSSARNKGLENAKGKYICFVDSDDYIGGRLALEELYNIGEDDKSDIVVGNCFEVYHDGSRKEIRRDKEIFIRSCLDSKKFLISFREKNCMYSAVWMNIYRKDFIKENRFIFKEGIYHEDEEFTPRVFLAANKISIYPKAFYAYRIRQGSIMNTKNKKRAYDIIDTCISLEKEFRNIKNKNLKKLMLEHEIKLLLKACYDNRISKIPKGTKRFILKNTYDKKLRSHGILFCVTRKGYYKFIDYKNR